MKWLLILTISVMLVSVLACGGATKIAYVSTRDAIYVMDADGTNQTRVTTDRDLASISCWSNDNKRLAFLSLRDSQTSLVVIDIDGSNETVINLNIIPEVSQDNFEILWLTPGCWHPTSDKILVTVDLPWGAESESKIYEVNLEDGVAKFVIDNATAHSWSPNGDKLAIYREDFSHIIKTGDNKTLTKDLIEGYCYSWSPDGGKLVCTEYDETDDKENIVTINEDGTEKSTVGLAPLEEEELVFLPTFSPDGEKILFSKGNEETCGIYTVNLDGTEETKLLDREDACIGVYSNP